jgi:hypothetical protein
MKKVTAAFYRAWAGIDERIKKQGSWVFHQVVDPIQMSTPVGIHCDFSQRIMHGP